MVLTDDGRGRGVRIKPHLVQPHCGSQASPPCREPSGQGPDTAIPPRRSAPAHHQMSGLLWTHTSLWLSQVHRPQGCETVTRYPSLSEEGEFGCLQSGLCFHCKRWLRYLVRKQDPASCAVWQKIKNKIKGRGTVWRRRQDPDHGDL